MSCFCWETRVYRINRVEVNAAYGESLHVRLPCRLNSHEWPVFLETLPRSSLCELVQMACWNQVCLNSHWLFLNLFGLSRAQTGVSRSGGLLSWWVPSSRTCLVLPAPNPHIIVHFPKGDKEGGPCVSESWRELSHVQGTASSVFSLVCTGTFAVCAKFSTPETECSPPPWGPRSDTSIPWGGSRTAREI